ncbi:caspase family protein [Frigidibacter sp. ROC022]|uniref:caspase family protein n=1 Tax=Frigidibacter sp. ROC022 TaxID=2971796 RepID=UPI00215AC8FB|nr:caspase family protein [Frigidibacter sp. ROC022]MCR8722963.1 caspase family protein [Frigidibacter sp. ROC022]
MFVQTLARSLARLVLGLALSLPAQTAAAKSLALLIGNDAYTEIAPLRTARADAGGYAQLFQSMGFAVTEAHDLTGSAMRVTLARFYDSIAPGDTVVFVYSGHGWSDGQQNYLVPVDIQASGSATLLSVESFPVRNGVNGIVDQINRRAPGLLVAILDACRNNPFTDDSGTRSVGLTRGLVPVQAPSGTFIAFSAGAGQTALDRLSDEDPARYSVFTRVFLDELAKGQDLQSAFKTTQARVSELAAAIGHQQRPAYYDEVIGAACLSGVCGAPPREAATEDAPPAATPVTDPVAIAAREWQDFKSTTSIPALIAFAERHAGTPYAELARGRIAELRAAAAPDPEDVPDAAPQPEPPEVAATPTPGAREVTEGDRPDWCRAAATPTELAICADASLAGQDIRMARQYATLLKSLAQDAGSRLKSDQRNWLKRRNACGADVTCLQAAYRDRLAELARY